MDPARRKALQARKEMMQLRLRRRQLSRVFREAARLLCAQGVRLSKSMPAANERSLGPLAAGPAEDEELLFAWMGNATVRHWLDDAEAAHLVREALAACSRPDELVTVIWSPSEPGLRLKARDLARHVPLMLDRDSTTLIVASRPSCWIVQIGRFSGTVAFSPNVPLRTDSRHLRYPPAAR
jgi:hypothetical protein